MHPSLKRAAARLTRESPPLNKLNEALSPSESKVLTAKHIASLRLLCTVGGSQARLDVRTEFGSLAVLAKGGVKPVRALASAPSMRAIPYA